MQAEVSLTPRALDHPDVARLVAQLQAEYVTIYGGPDGTPMSADQFAPPAGGFLVAYAGGEAVAMGGWRFRADVTGADGVRPAEIKRMYVVAAARRTGLARRVLAALEDDARAAGADVMVLETGTPQPGAEEFYRSAGYTDTVRFGHYADQPHTVYLQRVL